MGEYVAKLSLSIEGEGGEEALRRAVWACVDGFAMSEEDAIPTIETVFNPRCVPPWPHKDLVAKIRGALRKHNPTRGHLLEGHSPHAGGNRTSPHAKKSLSEATPKPTSIFLLPDEPATLWKRTTFPNGGMSETFFRWNGFYYVPERVPSHLACEMVYDWSDGLGYPRHLVDRLEFQKKPTEAKRRKMVVPYHWSDHRHRYEQGKGGLSRVPFRACELKNASHVAIVEGEKCAVALARAWQDHREIAVTAGCWNLPCGLRVEGYRK